MMSFSIRRVMLSQAGVHRVVGGSRHFAVRCNVPIAIPPPPPVSNTVTRARFITKVIFGSITGYLIWVLLFKAKDSENYWFIKLESTTDVSPMKPAPAATANALPSPAPVATTAVSTPTAGTSASSDSASSVASPLPPAATAATVPSTVSK